MFGLGFGASGTVGTFAEQALEMSGLGGVNTALTRLGLFMTVWQVAMDITNGKDTDAAIIAYKGLSGFAIGTWGARSLQISSIVFFVVDVTLTTFGNEAWAQREQAWRMIYRGYYADKDKAARAGELGSQGYYPPTKEERLAQIKSRTEGGRSLNEWKILLAYYYENASDPKRFEDILIAELDRYVAKYWSSLQFDEYVADAAGGTAGLARGTSLTEDIKTKLETEHKSILLAKLMRDVFPEIATKAWIKGLEANTRKLNTDILHELNDVIRVEISTYDLSGEAKFAMLLPAGGQWSGTLDIGKGRTIQISKIAYLKGGLPDTVRLETPSGPQERRFIIENDAASVVFGTPRTELVSAYQRSETPLNCTITRTSKTGAPETRTESRPAPSPGIIHAAVPAPGQYVLGLFSAAGGWKLASPGASSSDGRRSLFSTPYFEGIHSLQNCTSDQKSGDFFGSFGIKRCEIERRETTKAADGATLEASCSSTMSLTLEGAFTRQDDAMVYVPLDKKMFGEMEKGYRDALRAQEAMPGGQHIVPDIDQLMKGLPQ